MPATRASRANGVEKAATTDPTLSSRYGDWKEAFANPADGSLGTDDIPQAAENLRKAFDTEKTISRDWRIGQLKACARMLSEGADELCAAMQADLHRSPFEGFVIELNLVNAEIQQAIGMLDKWMAPKYTELSALNIPCWSRTVCEPYGVVLVLGPWNYPVQITMAPLVAAIAAGNCVMVKPGSFAQHTSHALSRLIQRYLDPECIKVAEGDKDVTTALLEERWDKIAFTGSAYVGRIVAQAAAKHLTPCLLELGGKSPCIVDKSCHLEHTAQRLVWGAFLNAGQTCVRPDFLLVDALVADALLAKIKQAIVDFYGSDTAATPYFGRMINAKAFARLRAILDDAPSHVRRIGGSYDEGALYIEPTILDYGTDEKGFCASAAMQDEIFGPILPVLRYEGGVETALRLARQCSHGKPLAFYCYARDGDVKDQICRRTTSGGLCLNDNLMHLANRDLPFGGVGASGMGAYHGARSFLAFSHEKAVLEKSPLLDESFLLKPLLAARFPPYTPVKKFLLKAFSLRLADHLVNAHRRPVVWLALILLVAWRVLGLRITWDA